MPVATRAGHLRARTGPRDPELRRARSCYDHLAGDLAVKMFDRFVERRLLVRRGDELRVSRDGETFFECAGIDLGALQAAASCAGPASTGASGAAILAARWVPRSSITSWRGAGRCAKQSPAWCGSRPRASRSCPPGSRAITSRTAAAYRATPAGRRTPPRAALEQRIAHLSLDSLGVVDAVHHQRRNLHPRGPHDADVLVALERRGEIAVAFVRRSRQGRSRLPAPSPRPGRCTAPSDARRRRAASPRPSVQFSTGSRCADDVAAELLGNAQHAQRRGAASGKQRQHVVRRRHPRRRSAASGRSPPCSRG